MLEDVLAALAGCAALEVRLVVTEDTDVAALASHHDFDVASDPGDGLNAAVRSGATAVAGRATDLLVVHGDLPLARAEDFTVLAARHLAGSGLTLVPDHADDGTNCLALSDVHCALPAFPFAFGRASFDAHRAAGRHLGITADGRAAAVARARRRPARGRRRRGRCLGRSRAVAFPAILPV